VTDVAKDSGAGAADRCRADDTSAIPGLPTSFTRDGRPTNLVFALVAVVAVVAALAVGVLGYGAPLPLMMVVGFCIALAAAALRGVRYADAETAAFDMIRRGFQPLLIFVAVGALIGSWILSGTVPTMIYLGVELINPSFFLPTAILLCTITSFINGTSFGTVATIGLALMGVASALDIPAGVAAGAIVCGAVFGDKMSPVSDTTILAAGLSNVPLVAHIRHMMWTTIPAIVMSLVFFIVIGAGYDTDATGLDRVGQVSDGLSEAFSIGWVPLIPPLLVFALLIARMEAFPALVSGVVAGVVVAVFYQGVDLSTTLTALWNGFVPTAAQADVADLVGGGETGGALKMLGLASIVIFALGIAGALSAAGVLQSILTALEPHCRTPRRLVPATLGLTALFNVVGGAVNFATAMGITLLRPLYDGQQLDRKNLSRAAEDAGTTTGPLVPWNASAVFTAASLGVSVGTYAPWALFCYLTPLVSLLYGLTGWTIHRNPAAATDDMPGAAGNTAGATEDSGQRAPA